MSPVPEKESKLPVSALCSAADEGNPPWGRFVHRYYSSCPDRFGSSTSSVPGSDIGRCFVCSDLLDGMQSELLLYKVGKVVRNISSSSSPGSCFFFYGFTICL